MSCCHPALAACGCGPCHPRPLPPVPWPHVLMRRPLLIARYLREYLHLPADSVPNTLKKSTKPAAPPPRPGAEGPDGRPPRAPRPEGGREGGYRGGEGGAPRGFGRGGGAPRPAGP